MCAYFPIKGHIFIRLNSLHRVDTIEEPHIRHMHDNGAHNQKER
jgi:hypothetical protein